MAILVQPLLGFLLALTNFDNYGSVKQTGKEYSSLRMSFSKVPFAFFQPEEDSYADWQLACTVT